MYNSFKTVRFSWMSANKMCREQYTVRSWDEYHRVAQSMSSRGFSMEWEREIEG